MGAHFFFYSFFFLVRFFFLPLFVVHKKKRVQSVPLAVGLITKGDLVVGGEARG